MFIQDLFKEENKTLLSAYGVELPPRTNTEFYDNIDDYSQPPENLEFIGFILDLDGEGEIVEELLDLILSYKLTNLPVAIEVPSHLVRINEDDEDPDFPRISLKSLLVLSSNLDCSLSFLPPKHPMVNSSYSNEEYTLLMAATTQALLNKPNHSQLTLPLSNYQEYLMLEQILGSSHENIKNFKPDDEYILSHFTPYSSVEEQNQFKEAIKQVIFKHYGGENEFKSICQMIFQGINEKSKSFYKNHILHHLEEQKKLETPS